jgi:hypothetical protein
MDFLNVILGPVLGTIGTLYGKQLDIKAKKIDNEFNLKKFEHEVNMRKEERAAAQEANEQAMAMNAAVTESDLARTIATGSYAGLTASIEAEGKISSYKWVDAVRGLVRPVLTTVTGITVGVIAFTSTGDIQSSTVAALTTQFGMAMAWWFGDRPSGQFQTKWQK